ncbi:hypothetical protein CUMW_254100 [Citrus unshiu]|uniref:Uncharacterized protein n=1 Tax=Citrus unshiu TaxID=55188 RepID=A0A2H5QR84_CITUN|nr:hypothetical protein CUMW_254100 [Citrus unshiu]
MQIHLMIITISAEIFNPLLNCFVGKRSQKGSFQEVLRF